MTDWMMASARLTGAASQRHKTVVESLKKHPRTCHMRLDSPDIVREAMALWAAQMIQEHGLNDDGTLVDEDEGL